MIPLRELRDLDDIPEFLTAEIGHFFDIYKSSSQARAAMSAGGRPGGGEKIIEAAFARARRIRTTTAEAPAPATTS